VQHASGPSAEQHGARLLHVVGGGLGLKRRCLEPPCRSGVGQRGLLALLGRNEVSCEERFGTRTLARGLAERRSNLFDRRQRRTLCIFGCLEAPRRRSGLARACGPRRRW
jgi:hypothetical protein